MKLQQEEDLNAASAAAAAGAVGPVPSQSSLRQPRSTSAASSVGKSEKKSDGVRHAASRC